MSTIEFVRDLLAPTALLTAEHDAVVSRRRCEPLRAAIRNLVFERVIAARHNNICDRPAFAAAVQEALARIEAV
jgi:pimeloyl-ACP methyl ester carboxylesterase